MKNRFAAVTFAALTLLATTGASLASGNLVAAVDIATQTMTVTYDGKVVEQWKVSTAGVGYHTPTGSYKPTRMQKMWYSRKYDMSPMPHSIFFQGGYAIHGTGSIKRLGTPASHGCVRLHPTNAARLYALVQKAGPMNTEIVISN